MDAIHITLRILHIVAGVLWVGLATFQFVFLVPASRTLGPQAGPVMAHLNVRMRLPIVTAASAVVTILAGLALYWRDSDGLDPDWITSPVGLGFTVGGLAAIVGFALGISFARPAATRMGQIAAAIADAGGPPTGEQASEMQALQRRVLGTGRLILFLLAIAVVAMAVARYLD